MTAGYSPASEEEHLKARIAWFYFVGGMTQQQIADQMGVTRLRVNRTIGQVRAEGSVYIDLRLPLADCVMLEEEIRKRYDLEQVLVVPTMDGYGKMQRTIGEAAGQMLQAHLPRHRGLGVGWGQTLSHSVRRICGQKGNLDHVVGLMGAIPHGSGSNTIEVATAMARRLDVECYYLTAPIFCRSAEIREALLGDEDLADAMTKADAAEVALVTCGDLSHHSSVMSLTMVRKALPELEELETVGDILGCFLSADGEIIDHPLNRSIIALSPELLRNKPVSILASGGRNKLPITRAILRGGYVNRLVTDESVARALIYET
ncbi:MAG: sugar-binding transcriptional regulator [Tropicimonas sp.]